MVNVAFISQLIESMESAVLQLEQAFSEENGSDKVNELKILILDLYKQVNDVIEGKNV